MLVTSVSEADFTEDACSAIVKLVEAAASAVPQEQRHKALQLVLDKSDSDATRKQARKLLKGAHRRPEAKIRNPRPEGRKKAEIRNPRPLIACLGPYSFEALQLAVQGVAYRIFCVLPDRL